MSAWMTKDHPRSEGMVPTGASQGAMLEYADPAEVCLSVVRGDPRLCTLRPDHRGHHSAQTYYCDGCGQTRRGRPEASNEDIAMCFMCVRGVL